MVLRQTSPKSQWPKKSCFFLNQSLLKSDDSPGQLSSIQCLSDPGSLFYGSTIPTQSLHSCQQSERCRKVTQRLLPNSVRNGAHFCSLYSDQKLSGGRSHLITRRLAGKSSLLSALGGEETWIWVSTPQVYHSSQFWNDLVKIQHDAMEKAWEWDSAGLGIGTG